MLASNKVYKFISVLEVYLVGHGLAILRPFVAYKCILMGFYLNAIMHCQSSIHI